MKLRCSSLPSLMAAPCSVLAPGTRIERANGASADGSAAHEVLVRLVVSPEAVDDALVAEAAARHGADAKEVAILVAQGRKLWAARERDYLAPMVEVELAADVRDGPGTVTLTGHADVVAVSADGVARVADWKTGRVDRDHYWQLVGYALLVMAEWDHVHTVHIETWWVRDGEAETWTLRRADASALAARIVDAAQWRGRYTTGPECRWCSLAHACEARTALVRADVAALLADAPADVATMPASDAHAVYHAAKRLEDACERVLAALRERAANAPIEHDGQALVVREVAGPRSVDVARAWPALMAHGLLDEDAVSRTVKVVLGGAEDVLRERAAKGKGAAAVREFRAALEEAGAVAPTTINRFELRRHAPREETT